MPKNYKVELVKADGKVIPWADPVAGGDIDQAKANFKIAACGLTDADLQTMTGLQIDALFADFCDLLLITDYRLTEEAAATPVPAAAAVPTPAAGPSIDADALVDAAVSKANALRDGKPTSSSGDAGFDAVIDGMAKQANKDAGR